jgi:hypothetical protein
MEPRLRDEGGNRRAEAGFSVESELALLAVLSITPPQIHPDEFAA